MNYFLEEWVDPSKIFSGKRNPHVAISTIPLLLTTMKSHSQFEANYLLDRIYNKALQSNKLNFDRFSVEPDVNSAFPINNKLNLPFVGNDAKAFCFQINRQVRSCDPCLEKARAKLNNSFHLLSWKLNRNVWSFEKAIQNSHLHLWPASHLSEIIMIRKSTKCYIILLSFWKQYVSKTHQLSLS